MSFGTTKKFDQHTANLRAVDRAFKEAFAVAKFAIQTENSNLESSQTKLCGLLLGVWAETRLSKLLNEQSFFNDSDKERIFQIDNLYFRWKEVVDHGFKKHYNANVISDKSLGHTAYHQYLAPKEHLEHYIKPILELRNRLAHGQWIYPFASNQPNGEVVSEKFLELRNMNIQSLNQQHLVLKYLSDLIFLLMANKSAFQRDFDTLYRKIIHQTHRLEKQSYSDYKTKLISNFQQNARSNSYPLRG